MITRASEASLTDFLLHFLQGRDTNRFRPVELSRQGGVSQGLVSFFLSTHLVQGDIPQPEALTGSRVFFRLCASAASVGAWRRRVARHRVLQQLKGRAVGAPVLGQPPGALRLRHLLRPRYRHHRSRRPVRRRVPARQRGGVGVLHCGFVRGNFIANANDSRYRNQ